MNGTTVALLLGGAYLLSRQGGASRVLNPAGQVPKASQQPSSAGGGSSGGSKGGGGAPAGQGASSTAGRGGPAKSGGGAQQGTSIEDVFTLNTNDGVSVIDSLWDEFQNTPDVAPDLGFLGNVNENDIGNIAESFNGGGAPIFGGDPSFEIDPSSGLVINPDTGLPFGQDGSGGGEEWNFDPGDDLGDFDFDF